MKAMPIKEPILDSDDEAKACIIIAISL